MATTAGGLPYVESSDLVSGYPAVSLALAEELDDQLALKAPLASPTFTGTVDFSGATVTGLAASGLVLLTPSSLANTGGSASLSGAEVTFSGITSLSVNGVFSSTYDNYLITFTSSIAAGAGVYTYLRLRVAGTDASGGSTYITQEMNADGASVGPTRSTSAESRIMTVSVTDECAYTINVYKPAIAVSSKITSFGYYGYNGASIYQTAASHTTATAYDGFTVYPASSSLTGKLRVYGYAKS